MNIWIDGSGFNGKVSRYCVLFDDNEAHRIVETFSDDYTNNTMEYKVLIRALIECGKGDTIYTDSKLVVGQLLEGWNINYDHLRELAAEAKKLLTIKKASLVWVRREDNRAGIYLERLLRKEVA